MTTPKIQNIVFDNTPFQYPCNIYKESAIPILKENNIEQCKESIKNILNMTKTPLSQHLDVLIPNLDRTDFENDNLNKVKKFFGEKYTPTEENQQQQTTFELKHNSKSNTVNACIFETSTSNYIKELISTEKTHVTYLEEIVYKCMIPIKESIDKKSPILDQYSFNRIFRNTDDLLTANKAFLDSLNQYKNGTTNDSFGEIFVKHIDSFDCYKIYYLGQTSAASCHTQNIKQNKNYPKFLVNSNFIGSLELNDMVGEIIRRLGRYALLLKCIVKEMDPSDSDVDRLKYCLEKLDYLNNVHYGDSSLLNLYHRIKDAPASLIQKRQLLGYCDANELSLVTGKLVRPVTILVFDDKLMVVKRKNSSLRGKDVLENIEDKPIDKLSVLQKAKEAYNGSPFEFKGWVDIKTVEMFNGLKDHSDTFFVRTNLPEQSPDATEKECEEYFRRSDRLYSIVSNSSPKSLKKESLIALCQKQVALSKLKDTNNELYIENKFKLPAYTHFYNEKSYRQAKYKNNILIVYVEERLPAHDIHINNLINDDVWVVILLSNKPGGYKLNIRAKTNLLPIREISRELDYETLIKPTKKEINGPLDFIDSLWNNVFFYERRLRATPAYSNINDSLLRGRARSRSRSKSLTRVASSMSIGKIFRSRSSSPSRPSSIESQESHVADPVFKIATVNKQQGNEFRDFKISAQTLIQEDAAFIDQFQPQTQQVIQDETLCGPFYQGSYRRGSSTINGFQYDSMPPSQYPELISRPNSSNDSFASSDTNPADDLSHNNRNSNDDKFTDITSSYDLDGSMRSYDNIVMSTIDNSRWAFNGSIRKPPLKSIFYNQAPIVPHRSHQTTYTHTQIKNDVIEIIEGILQSQNQFRQDDVNEFCLKRLQAIVSRIDDCTD